MTKADIVVAIYEKVGISKTESSDVVESVFEILKETLRIDSGRLDIPDSGKAVPGGAGDAPAGSACAAFFAPVRPDHAAHGDREEARP